MSFHILLLFLFLGLVPQTLASPGAQAPAFPASGDQAAQMAHFPKPLPNYQDAALPLRERLESRAKAEPFNVVASVIFLGAILHTFLAGFFARWAHRVEERFAVAKEQQPQAGPEVTGAQKDVSFLATVLHYLGEVEAIFMLWAIPLLGAALYFFGHHDVTQFVGADCDFREPLFVVIIMTISASRPVVRFAEQCLAMVAHRIGKGSPAAWWLSVLTVAPVLGSVITEPAAMTIGALLLARRFYDEHPGKVFAYATLGLLFVNISVGGVLTNFAAPPVLMVAAKWEWSSWFMLSHFGWRAILAILLSNAVYFLLFRHQLKAMGTRLADDPDPARPIFWNDREDAIPRSVTVVHLAFLAWTVLTNHYPPLYLGGFLFFIGFMQATARHQNPLQLRSPVLVGFFLAGLVIHGRCQGWWLEPILASGLSEIQLLLGAAALTAFNDNALITFLASQVPDLGDNMKYAIMAGAVAGGGLTVIANAPNPAGQGLLKGYFSGNVNPLFLFLAAAVPTAIAIGCFLLAR
jgi:Putative Na+/H+ antiporter